MLFERVAIAAASYLLPDERVASEELERRLEPVYRRFGLHAGRLELMTGIRERRFFPPGTRSSAVAARAGRAALEQAGLEPGRIGLLIHGSVCRDFLEPATASVVHHALELAPTCAAFDLSNACLGMQNGLVTIAAQIEHGVIEAGLVVGGECGRPLVERTIAHLLATPDLSKSALKSAFASLTIGSGAAAILLARRDLAPEGARVVGATLRAATEHNELCHGDYSGDDGMWMATDSEALMHAGNDLAQRTFDAFRAELGWTREEIERIVTHQVGSAHRKLLLHSLGLDLGLDVPTFETLGNVGSVSLPLSYARAKEVGFIRRGQRVALMGIGSGLHCAMVALQE
jgi:acyl-CoA:acyl-CoA alkyltransferase